MNETGQRRSRLARVFLAIALLLVVVNGFFPSVWLFLTSLKRDGELTQLPITYLPQAPTLDNYVAVFERNPFALFLRNSFVVSIAATLVCVLFAGLAGYALGRLRPRGRRAILTGIVMTSMFPSLVLLVPLYRLFRGVEVPWLSGFLFFPDVVTTPNLLNSYWALIVPYVALSLPIATMILTSFFQLIPDDLEAAATVDGTSRLGALFHIIMPLSAPGESLNSSCSSNAAY